MFYLTSHVAESSVQLYKILIAQLQAAALGMLNRQRVSANGFLSPYAMDAPALGMDGPYYTEATVEIGRAHV